jgi:peroxiredoxin
MAVESGPTALGTALPEVSLPDLDGRVVDLPSYADGHLLLVVFAANHCPYVRWVEREVAAIAAETAGLRVVAISPNDADEYPDDGPDGLREQARRAGWQFPYLLDSTQEVARTFGAVCTPDFFLFDAEGRLSYRGALDASSPKNGRPLTGDALRTAVRCTLAGEPVPTPHQPAMGCGIKWRAS